MTPTPSPLNPNLNLNLNLFFLISSLRSRMGEDFCHAPVSGYSEKIRLPQSGFPGKVCSMSAVELAVRKVKKLSAREARELLGWLDEGRAKGTALQGRPRTMRRKTTAHERLMKLKSWEDSVRGTTDWEPPRMPDDLAKPFLL
jgi:hypothetical protein